jgi:hypothetical protein
MSVFTELDTKLSDLKKELTGDLHTLVTKLQAVAHHVQASNVEPVVKEAVATDLHDATQKVADVADTLRADADVADKAVDTADVAVDDVAAK